ncbi:hypothetical protein BAUCODRAFT_70969 [Baudoinia panamericana UAMH 10762]|uniref:histidine kinase n=1 Tax=Baudoinia panamericana (strain UAMH 10762) TaxID=717646 RepID=M2MHK0_BAUPA|nr:uncharacterized protein BAUCODRAFT_70969 [Baudoinia panamericana UAMH 10762]EMC96086.1 hypothetical protein BAUCODRAFT_70969 [Baudoinia panamericana UAMH 10762]
MTGSPTSSRPHLSRMVRSPPGRLSELPQTSPEQILSPRQKVKTPEQQGERQRAQSSNATASGEIRPEIMRVISGTEEEKLEKLKEAVNAKLALQQRKRGSYGGKRVSPIREEDNQMISPSLNAAFASPVEPAPRPLSTDSTESTESTGSSRTVRASLPPTPAEGRPLRTPSYPFPYVPGTPRTWSSNFHQPFTALSPTTTMNAGLDDTPGQRSVDVTSAGSTPGVQDFAPPGVAPHGVEDPRFPTPNLYDLVLQLNAEPGIEQWWATVTNLMHDFYKAERVTLVVPMDATDIENVPWGQKATFSMYGREEFVPHGTILEQVSQADVKEASTDALADWHMQKLHPERLGRPRLESRHSYAGPPPKRDAPPTVYEATLRSARPRGPQRTVTHAGMFGSRAQSRGLPHRYPSTSSVRHTSISDPDFSSIAGGVDTGPYAEVFQTLRALDHEARPLIESGGVNRVLDRGRVVTITRDYSSDPSDSSNGPSSGTTSRASNLPDTTPVENASVSATRQLFGNYRTNAFASENAFGFQRDYEEYEQYPQSPWAQSPAPSPAIQGDEESNPFFASEEQEVEDSFNPANNTPRDYSQYNQVEAIGVDSASTVIHVPLVHPTLSQPMQSLRMRQPRDHPGMPQRSNTLDMERKAPIAMLSILSQTVPYPHNLTQSLKLLAPHLATSFSTAQQFSASHQQAITIRHRRTASGHNVSTAPMTIEPASLEDIVNAELEEPPGSISGGSITSPSDYSGRSRHSPTSSIVGTPGWDPASHGWSNSRSVTGTPAMTGSEIVHDYFDQKRTHRTGHRSGSQTSQSAHTTPAKASARFVEEESKVSARKASPATKDDHKSSQSEQRLRAAKSVRDEKSPMRVVRAQSPTRQAEVASPQRPAMHYAVSQHNESTAADAFRRHSLLHSYGANYESSFGTLPASLNAENTPLSAAGHARKASYSEDMPPPSERLLRTIIDSVPVQIFTAKPDTGQLSWVNTKFLIYRGREPYQVLNEPWQAIHPDDRAEFMASWQRSLRTAQQLQQKVRLERFDGSFRWFYVRAAPLKDKRQKVVHWIGTMMDFHEQHLAELNATRQQETAASEAKYRTLANSSPQIVFAVNRSKGVTFCNSQWLHYSGQTEAQALGLGFMDHVHPDDLVKCKLPSFDDDSGKPTNVPTSVPTELKRTPTNSASSSSGSSETERGVNSSESSPLQTMPQRQLSELASTGILKVARDVDGRPFYSTEVRLRSKEGEYRWHLVRVLLAEPLLQQTEDEETWYGTCTDINDHKTLERDLKETMDEKSRFLSNMSHEIRTPLNGITGMVNFLIDSSLSAEQMEHVNIIRASTEGLRGLINDILDLSKAEAGMIQLSMDWMYVRALIEEVNDLTSAMAIDKGLELNYIVEEDVPTQIKGDRFRIRQILLNVIGNAIKFTQQGEVFVRCSVLTRSDVELAKNEMLIKFEVVDTGRGFTEKEAEYLFKRFSQIDGSSTRQHGGTGLGLVISRQLAQLHGGDMSAKGVPGKGSTFSFYIKTTLPSRFDQPPAPPPTPGLMTMSSLPGFPGLASTPLSMPRLTKIPSLPDQPRPSPRFASETTSTPSPYMSPDLGRPSPAASISSASSEPSILSAARTSSLKSERSSASSYVPDPAFTGPTVSLSLPDHRKSDSPSGASEQSVDTVRRISTPDIVGHLSPGGSMVPPLYSILVICPLKYSREATVQHIDKTVPKNVPHSITAREHLLECQKMLGGEDPVIFTHIVVVLQDVEEITALMDQILSSPAHSGTSIIIITDLAQKRKIIEQAPRYNYEALTEERRLRFVFKPLKPSRFAIIFDPQKEREMSTDRNQDSAQQVAVNQKQVFEELTARLGDKGKRVLLVEDNKVNQMVILKFLKKVSIPADTVMDGVQCTEKVFAQPHGYYSIILCDLHMPNKDGYQTCKEIRRWEKKNKYPYSPIIALSANVLGDVYQKCVEAGFNSYMTKPVDFKELAQVLMTFMDPSDPTKPFELMKGKRMTGASQR